ncbi:hypothetical protein GobsT_53400 [Gemmata obscuriglobus]|uniref:Uncharacterized protein n=1 Tax=Gemmata obscuriglobus TaxID=114 RepID=A0A2Z3GW52_9BACT|nr:hypothetical protein [Gemmata obscuriglobus]AWM36801.1 hypothetical protein C1280_07060 [Gemmata obscuriglobus]QEG30535.1 hypothetical protein GobsT_53400 [Gemmata obscuriglobus]VTS09859.1 unnamed protein product [Gemmata obscuriglobus UQM 2246]
MSDVQLAPGARSAPRPKGGRALVAVTAVLFVGWLCWLGYTALTRSHSPYISRAQAAGASVAVVAELTAGADGRIVVLTRPGRVADAADLKEAADRPAVKVSVVESWKGGPEKGASIGVTNLSACSGYTGPGTYLLLLSPVPDAVVENLPAYTVAGAQRSPGSDPPEAAALRIYPWTEQTSADLRKQVEVLFR